MYLKHGTDYPLCNCISNDYDAGFLYKFPTDWMGISFCRRCKIFHKFSIHIGICMQIYYELLHANAVQVDWMTMVVTMIVTLSGLSFLRFLKHAFQRSSQRNGNSLVLHSMFVPNALEISRIPLKETDIDSLTYQLFEVKCLEWNEKLLNSFRILFQPKFEL